MRIIEPKRNDVHRSSKTKAKSAKFLIAFISFFLIGFSFLLYSRKNKISSSSNSPSTAIASASTVQDLRKVAGARDVKFAFFTGDQYQRLYESLIFPNTELITIQPSITGNEAADSRIRIIAASRGYKLRSVPVLPIVKVNEPKLIDDDLLQPKAINGWQVLKSMAVQNGIPLRLNSGYRSIEYQRQLFVSRLRANGGNILQIANGQADNAVVQTLSITAPPGYSRHHTGYTIDLACDDNTGSVFEKTVCFQWLSANNYDNAKRAGWVPSYPIDASDQGPEPEAWEYVWVGLNQVIQQ